MTVKDVCSDVTGHIREDDDAAVPTISTSSAVENGIGIREKEKGE